MELNFMHKRRATALALSLAALIAAGCQSEQGAEKGRTGEALAQATIQPATTASTDAAGNSAEAATQSALKEFQAFWSEFRAAVKADDRTKIASLTAFPFKTKGEGDGADVQKHDKDSFLKILAGLRPGSQSEGGQDALVDRPEGGDQQ
jgi:hypothetical protein